MPNPESLSDAALLRLALAGDEPAFLALYERLKRGIFRYAFYMTNSRTAAEEVTQELFIALLKEGGSFREDRGEVGAFAFGIARNLVRRIERRERAYQPLPHEEDLESLPGRLISKPEVITGELVRTERAGRVQAAIASLPDHYRQAVVLCDLCELTYEEAATRLQCAVGTIRSRLSRAHALLAKKLEPLKENQSRVESTGTEGCLI